LGLAKEGINTNLYLIAILLRNMKD
jgi:hypothetical protein